MTLAQEFLDKVATILREGREGESMTCAICGKPIQPAELRRRIKGKTPAWQDRKATVHSTCKREESMSTHTAGKLTYDRAVAQLNIKGAPYEQAQIA